MYIVYPILLITFFILLCKYFLQTFGEGCINSTIKKQTESTKSAKIYYYYKSTIKNVSYHIYIHIQNFPANVLSHYICDPN